MGTRILPVELQRDTYQRSKPQHSLNGVFYICKVYFLHKFIADPHHPTLTLSALMMNHQTVESQLKMVEGHQYEQHPIESLEWQSYFVNMQQIFH